MLKTPSVTFSSTGLSFAPSGPPLKDKKPQMEGPSETLIPGCVGVASHPALSVGLALRPHKRETKKGHKMRVPDRGQ
jgi:hypothetical protein